jgi:hypothetical protein
MGVRTYVADRGVPLRLFDPGPAPPDRRVEVICRMPASAERVQLVRVGAEVRTLYQLLMTASAWDAHAASADPRWDVWRVGSMIYATRLGPPLGDGPASPPATGHDGRQGESPRRR